MTDNPFAVLTAVVAPAVLTNACSVLSLGTANRFGRVVDRSRVLVAELAALPPGSEEHQSRVRQLERLRIRGGMLLQALRAFYASLGLFAAAALISVMGSALAYYDQKFAFQAAAAGGLATGGLAVIGLVFGCASMVHETRLAMDNMVDEADLARTTYLSGEGHGT